MLGIKQLCDQRLHHPLRGQVRKLVRGPCQIDGLIVQSSTITLEADQRQGNHRHAFGWKLLSSWTSDYSAILVSALAHTWCVQDTLGWTRGVPQAEPAERSGPFSPTGPG